MLSQCFRLQSCIQLYIKFVRSTVPSTCVIETAVQNYGRHLDHFSCTAFKPRPHQPQCRRNIIQCYEPMSRTILSFLATMSDNVSFFIDEVEQIQGRTKDKWGFVRKSGDESPSLGPNWGKAAVEGLADKSPRS